MKLQVRVKNVDPCWVEYGYLVDVEVPDDAVWHLADPADRTSGALYDAALEVIYAGGGEIEWGPNVLGTIESLDNEYEVVEVQRLSQVADAECPVCEHYGVLACAAHNPHLRPRSELRRWADDHGEDYHEAVRQEQKGAGDGC